MKAPMQMNINSISPAVKTKEDTCTMCRHSLKIVLPLKQLRCSVGWWPLVFKCYWKNQLKFNNFLKLPTRSSFPAKTDQTFMSCTLVLGFFFLLRVSLLSAKAFEAPNIWKCSLCWANQGKCLFITSLLDSVISPLFFICGTWNWPFVFNTPWNQDLISAHYTRGHFWHTFSFWWIQSMLQLSRD